MSHLRVFALCLAPAVLVALLAAPAAPEEKQVAPKLPLIEAHSHKSYTETISGTKVKFEMIAIPGGAYQMGSPAGEKGRKGDEGPQHPVTVGALWVGKCEVTWDEWDLYYKDEGVRTKESGHNEPGGNEEKLKKNADAVTGPTPPYADETFGHGREGHPVIAITHHCGMEYCRWLSKKTGKHYRLPTEAEWEWACRAGSTTAYSFGDETARLKEYALFGQDGEGKTARVGTRKPNAWGLHDMHGNVAEWCLDYYDKNYYRTFALDNSTSCPVLLPTANRWPNVCRGGSWLDSEASCRSAARRGSDKSWLRLDPCRPQSIWWLIEAEFVGFRVVRAVDEQPNLKGIRSKITRLSN